MNTEDISIDKIHRHENSRVDPLTELNKIDTLMNSIKQFGLFHPIHVMKDGIGQDTYTIIMGNRRLKSCEKLGWKTIPSFVHYDVVAYKDFLLRNTSENIERKNIDEVELGRIFYELTLEETNMQPSELSVRFGMPVIRIKRAIDLYLKVPEEYRAKIKYMPDGGNLGKNKKQGNIPAHVAQKIINMTKRRGLGTHKKELWELASKDGFTGKDFNAIALLLNRGFTVNEALSVLHDCKIITLKLTVSRKSITSLINKYHLPMYQLIAKILSGKIKDNLDLIDLDTIKKP